MCLFVCVFNRMFNWVVKVVPQPPGAEEDKDPAVRDHGTHTGSIPSLSNLPFSYFRSLCPPCYSPVSGLLKKQR